MLKSKIEIGDIVVFHNVRGQVYSVLTDSDSVKVIAFPQGVQFQYGAKFQTWPVSSLRKEVHYARKTK